MLWLLLVVYVFNFTDRQILNILLEDIKRDLDLSDTGLGFLTGFAFALSYTVAGVSIARWADSGNRRKIIAMSLAVWSIATALCGAARSFSCFARDHFTLAVLVRATQWSKPTPTMSSSPAYGSGTNRTRSDAMPAT